LEKVGLNVRAADTEDLLDRATVYRAGMEPAALELIDRELRERGVSAEQIAEHARRREGSLVLGRDGLPVRCAKCGRPAVTEACRWHRVWGLVPLFPRRVALCAEHAG